MSDMTQPESDPQIQPQSSGEPTHIGIARYKDARESFLPQIPQDTTDTALDATIRPVDRSSVEKIHSQIDEITAKQAAEQKEESESFEFLGETRREKSGRFPLKRTIAGGLGVLAVTAAGFLGFNKIRSGEDGSERPGVIITDPTRDTTELTPTFTPEATPETEPEKTEKSPYEFGFSQKVGDVTVQITKQTQERTECPDPDSPINNAKMVPCNPLREIVVNKEVFPNAEELIKEEFLTGIYFAWQHAEKGRENVTFDEYMQRVEKGEDMSIKARGFQGRSFLPTEITISPTDEFFYDTIHEPVSIIRPWTSVGIGYRIVVNEEGKREFHLEIYDFTAGGVGDKELNSSTYGPGNLMAVGLTFLSYYDLQKQGSSFTSAQIDSLAPVVVPLRNIILKRVNGVPYSILGAK